MHEAQKKVRAESRQNGTAAKWMILINLVLWLAMIPVALCVEGASSYAWVIWPGLLVAAALEHMVAIRARKSDQGENSVKEIEDARRTYCGVPMKLKSGLGPRLMPWYFFLMGLVMGLCWLLLSDAVLGLDRPSVWRHEEVRLKEELRAITPPATDETLQSLAAKYGASYDTTTGRIRRRRPRTPDTSRGSYSEGGGYFDVPLIHRLSFGAFGRPAMCSEISFPVPSKDRTEK